MNDEQLLARLNSIAREIGIGGKQGMAAENRRAELVREAHKRGLLGMPSKRKHREKQ